MVGEDLGFLGFVLFFSLPCGLPESVPPDSLRSHTEYHCHPGDPEKRPAAVWKLDAGQEDFIYNDKERRRY